ncbi:MAG: hypothetical protein LM588_06360 [Fervidicoccaceae archaeon]|nr:hypothetical protein [Fervidicoccaceae archaeon]
MLLYSSRSRPTLWGLDFLGIDKLAICSAIHASPTLSWVFHESAVTIMTLIPNSALMKDRSAMTPCGSTSANST